MSRHHDEDAPRVVGSVTTAAREKGHSFVFATGADRLEYFIHRSHCRPSPLFDELLNGDLISFTWLLGPKGYQGHDVRRATPSDAQGYRDALTAQVDSRGNVAPPAHEETMVGRKPARRR